jgi:hypothetical protein
MIVHLDASVLSDDSLQADPGDLDRTHCPRCGSPTFNGFGLAGGGYGPWIACQACPWFKKEVLPEDAE